MEENLSENDAVSQMQKMEALGQFAGGIAHDFNNILSIIEGQTHISIKKLKDGTLTKEQLEKVLKSTQRGAGLTRQLLSFGRQKVDLDEKVNISESLHQLNDLLKPLLGAQVQLFMAIPESPVWVNTSEDQFMQIIMNLAINARDAMPDGGELAIMCMSCNRMTIPRSLKIKYPDTDFIRISVVDSGMGIETEVLSRVFDPFFTTKDQGKGTGLGLSVVYGIVDQLKGHIDVSSVVGEGTSFDVFLPLSEALPDEMRSDTRYFSSNKKVKTTVEGIVRNKIEEIIASEEFPIDSKSFAGKTILIAEDEEELREVLIELFSDMDMNVLSAGNGNQALLLQDDYDGKIDFLLTDVVMPEMDGVELGEMFESVRPDSNVIYMSGYPFMDGRKNINVPENAPFMSKPLNQEKIPQILERAMERRRERLKET